MLASMKLSSATMIVAAAQAAVDPVRVDPSNGAYVDSHGRTRIFHGMNVVYKKAPWIAPTETFDTTDSMDSETMANLQKWGFNVVRLGVMWPGVEPSLGEFDEDYLGAISNMAANLAEYGVYTIADLHQDVGSRRFCGEGFPEHYVDAMFADPTSKISKTWDFPSPLAVDLPKDPDGMPNQEECMKHQFAQYYFASQVGALWHELYMPGTPLNLGFSRFWGKVAETLGNASHLLAYELLNEPSGFCLDGTLSCLKTPGLVFGNAVERERLTPMYQAAAKAIRDAGGTQTIMYEATVLPKTADVFPEPVLGDDDQQALAYHIYCAPGDGASKTAGIICDVAQKIYDHTYFKWLDKHQSTAGFLTEFGAVAGNELELVHLNNLLKTTDDRLQGWAYWQLKKFQDITTANADESLYDEQGDLEVAKLKVLSRTYAQATAGKLSKMEFDPDSAVFEMDFTVTVTSAPTEIYLNEDLHYPNGHEVTVRPAGCFDVTSPMANYVHLNLVAESSPNYGGCVNQLINVRIEPSAAALV